MFFGNDIQDTRQLFFTSWKKYSQDQPLLPLEQQLVDVLLYHPEYQDVFSKEDIFSTQAYFPELGQTNPFLHMGLHLAVREQLATDRPVGITPVFQQLLAKYGDQHAVEHMIMELLAECLWQAQRNHTVPDEASYWQNLKALLS